MFEDVITLYHFTDGSNYIRTVIKNVFWNETKKSNVLKSGMSNADSVSVIIPTEGDIEIKEGKDLVVKGICEFRDNESVKKILCEQYDAKTVSIVDRKLHGELSHIELSCK